MKKKLIIVLELLLVCMPGITLSPPQYGLWRQIGATFGACPGVDVKEIYEENGIYNIDLIGSDADICKGLAVVLKSTYNYGGIQVEVRVFDREGNRYQRPERIEGNLKNAIHTHFRNALRDNPYFVRILDAPSFDWMPTIWLEFKPAVVQFFNDNIGDFYGNVNLIAAGAFEDLCETDISSGSVESYHIGFTTAPVKTESQAALYRLYP